MGFILMKFEPEQLKQVQQLSTTEGFCEAFAQNLTVSRTFTEAYEITETAHEELFGRRKYSEYSTFCRAHRKIRERD
jgi:hypothetical protein